MTMRCDEILISTGWDVKERKTKECTCVWFLFRLGQKGWVWRGGGGLLWAGLTEVLRAKVRGILVIRRGFACYGYGHGYHEEEKERKKER